MRVRCLSNKGSSLPKTYYDEKSGYTSKTNFNLVINKEYTVYGITIFLGHIWYYLCDESYSYFPIWQPAALFDVVDNRISKYWMYSFTHKRFLSSEIIYFAFKEWIDDPYFYDNLSDGKEEYKSIFKKYKKLMDLEFPDDSIKELAVVLNKTYLMCPFCDESWENTTNDAMVECPKCSRKMNNPNYEFVLGNASRR